MIDAKSYFRLNNYGMNEQFILKINYLNNIHEWLFKWIRIRWQILTAVETAMFSTAVVETAGASQTYQALERTLPSARNQFSIHSQHYSTWFDAKFNDVCSESVGVRCLLDRDFRGIRRNPFKQETRARRGRWGALLADSRYRAIIRLPGLPGTSALWNSPPDHPPSSLPPRRGISGSDVLLCHQYSSPASLLPPRSTPIVPFCSALAALADSSISRWVRARKEIKSTLMVFAISRHCVRAHHVRKYGSERGAFPRAFERIAIVRRRHGDYIIFFALSPYSKNNKLAL